jgi:hypothetical protein
VERLYARWQLTHPDVPPTPSIEDNLELVPFMKPDGTFFLHHEVFPVRIFNTYYDDEGSIRGPSARRLLQAGHVTPTFAVVVEDVPRVTPFGRCGSRCRLALACTTGSCACVCMCMRVCGLKSLSSAP